MTNKHILVYFLALSLVAQFFSGCSNSTNFSGPEPSISEGDEVIVFLAGAEENVIFLHKQHAETWGYECFVCHSHFDVRTTDAWSCRECHSNNDNEGLCADDAYNHDCMATQCYNCHLDDTVVPDPNPDCVYCHNPTYTGTFADSPVIGLRFETSSHIGTTYNNGNFQYLSGEYITFFVGPIVIGTGLTKTFMTPLDLVPGAESVANQTVINIARFLQSFDDDGNIDTEIVLPQDIHTSALGLSIDFDVDTATFESDPDLIALLDLYGFTLVSEADAQNHLQNSIDTRYPPATGTRISGAPNTHFVLQGHYEATEGVDYTYTWYRDCPAGGVSEIVGATTTAYQPGVDDIDCDILFEVSAHSAGSVSESDWFGPINADNPVTVYATIDAASEIDSYTFRVSGGADDDVIIDVLSVEADNLWRDAHHGNYSTCNHCHISGGDTNLDFPDGGDNGDLNDKLITNVYLYDTDGTTVLDQRDCLPDSCGLSNTCQPGCDAPGAGTISRNYTNPYMDISSSVGSLSPGDYTLKIGAAPVVFDTNAQGDDINTDGSYFANGPPWLYRFGGITYIRSNYKIIFTFN